MSTIIPRSASGVPGLDEVLHGGFIAGKLYLINGAPGAGKTTLGLQYLLQGIKEGETCLYVTLGEPASELRSTAESHGWSLDGIDIVEIISDESALLAESDLTMYHPSEIDLYETTNHIREAMDKFKPRRMVMDSLSELNLLAQTLLRYRSQVLALSQLLADRNCTALFLDNRTTEGVNTVVHSVAHGVIILDRTVPNYGPVQRQLHITKFRSSDFISGHQDCVLARGGWEVFPRLTPSEHRTVITYDVVPSGVSALDALLGGGTNRGTSTLLVGPSGTGKSTVAAQYAVAATRRGAHAVIFTFEEAKELLMHRLSALGLSVDEGAGLGKLVVHQIDPAEVLPSQFANMVRRAVDVEDATVVVIDSLSGYINAMPEKRALMIQLHELLSYLNSQGVATFLVSTQAGTLGESLHNEIDASYLTDAVVLFRMYEHAGALRKAISVVKKRSGPHEDTIRDLWFDAQGVHLGPPLKHLRGVMRGVPVEIEAAANRGAPSSDERAGRS